MDKRERTSTSEVNGESMNRKPDGSLSWPMDNIRMRYHQQQMESLLSPRTPVKNYSISHAKSLLLKCFRDSKSDPFHPRSPSRTRHFTVSGSAVQKLVGDDEGVLMDGVLVTSATGKKVSNTSSDSPSSSLGRSARSSVTRSQQKNTEFSSPKNESGRNQEPSRSLQSSAGKGKILANIPTDIESPKVTNPSKLLATAEPFTPASRPSPSLASPLHLQQPSYGLQPWTVQSPHSHSPLSYSTSRPYYGNIIRRPPQFLPQITHSIGTDLYHPTYQTTFPSPTRYPSPTSYQIPCHTTQSPTRNDPGNSYPTTPASTHQNTTKPTNTSDEADDLCTSPTHGSKLDWSPVNDLKTMTTKLDWSPVNELKTMKTKLDWSPPVERLQIMTVQLEFSPSVSELQTVTTKPDWSPSDDGLETLTPLQAEALLTSGRVLPFDPLKTYKYTKRLPVFTEFCPDD